jgi:7-cyano-7-deazaguanine synthase in queuosine biosynthesis
MLSVLAAHDVLSWGRNLPPRLPDYMHDIIMESLADAEEAQDVETKTVKWTMPRDTAILFSGGMDSFVAYRLALQEKRYIWAVSVAFNTPYVSKELAAINDLVDEENHVLIDLRMIDVEKRRSEWKHIIPLRNLICVLAASEYSVHEVWMSALRGELRGDKSLAFMEACSTFIGQDVRTPFENETKADIAHLYVSSDLGPREDLLRTVTCFGPGHKHCGKCRACLRRWLALKWAGFHWDEVVHQYESDPMVAAATDLVRYRMVMADALRKQDFSYYDERRIIQDLSLIGYPTSDDALQDVDPGKYSEYREDLECRTRG